MYMGFVQKKGNNGPRQILGLVAAWEMGQSKKGPMGLDRNPCTHFDNKNKKN